MAMTKSDLIELIAQTRGITKTRAELVVNCVFDTMASALEQGEGVEIRGFGSFTVREYGGYTGRNPRTHKPIRVAAKKLPFFRVGKELRERVNARAGTLLPDDAHDPDDDIDDETDDHDDE